MIASVGQYDTTDQQDVMARVSRKVFMGPTPMKLRKRLMSEELDEMVSEMIDEGSWDLSSPNALSSVVMSTGVDAQAAVEHVGTR